MPRIERPRRRRATREAKFELDFGDFEMVSDSVSRDKSGETTAVGKASPESGRVTSDNESGQPSRRRDKVQDEIEALERFEYAVRSVKSPSERTPSDLGQRIIVGVPAMIAAIFLVVQGGGIFAAGVAFFALAGVWELTRMFESARPSLIAGSIGVLALLGTAYFGTPDHMVAALVASFPIVFLGVAMQRQQGGMPGIAVTMLGIVWIGLAFAHAIMLRETNHGGGIVLNILFTTFAGDTGAYLGGKWLGSHKLAPKISPNKTIEGLLIGIAFAILVGWIAGLYEDWLTNGQALLLAAGVAVIAPIGDLFESFLKRGASIKDSGGMFGAHGGVLDRLDAVMFSMVVGYYIWTAFGGA